MADWTLHPLLAAQDSIKARLWYVLSDEASEAAIGPRVGLSVASWNNKLFIFGGASADGYQNDMWCLDSDMSWARVAAQGTPPSPRYDHGTFSTSSALWIVGGAGDQGNMEDLAKFSFATSSWDPVHVTGKAPSKRTHHQIAIDESHAYVFGGGESGLTPVDDSCVYTLALDDMTWTCRTGHGAAPTPRLGHSLAQHSGSLYMFGGVAQGSTCSDLFCYVTADNMWNRVEPKGAWPAARTGHSCWMMSSGQMVVHGGLSLSPHPHALDDMWIYDTHLHTWAEVTYANEPIAARLDAGCALWLRAPLKASADADVSTQAPPLSSATPTLNDVTASFGAVVDGVPASAPSRTHEAHVAPGAHATGSETERGSARDAELEADMARVQPVLVLYGGVDLEGNMHRDCLAYVLDDTN